MSFSLEEPETLGKNFCGGESELCAPEAQNCYGGWRGGHVLGPCLLGHPPYSQAGPRRQPDCPGQGPCCPEALWERGLVEGPGILQQPRSQERRSGLPKHV